MPNFQTAENTRRSKRIQMQSRGLVQDYESPALTVELQAQLFVIHCKLRGLRPSMGRAPRVSKQQVANYWPFCTLFHHGGTINSTAAFK
jgi:hypothetical protein